MLLSRAYCRGALLLAASFLAACAGQSGLPLTPSSSTSATNALVLPEAVPPACKGQKTTAKYASLTQTLATKGGQLCIPAFGGLGGSIQYPSTKLPIKMSLISSTTNYDKMPNLGSGKPVFYLQLAISGATLFGTKLPAGGGLTGKPIVAGQTYTVYGQFKLGGITEGLTPCYGVATKGTYGGVFGGLGSLLKGQTIPAPVTGVVEIYPGKGKKATGKC